MVITHTLTYGGISSSDYGIFISGEGVYNAPERNVELVSVPGRNGDLTIDKGSFANITIEYPCFTFAKSQAEFRRKVNDFKNALMSQVGYQKLADDYHPDDYRMALYINGLEVDPVHMGRAGSFTLQFICKPQRYLISGEDEVTVNDGDVINNPTLYDAEPLLMVEGYGDIEFNGYHIELLNGEIGPVDAPPEVSKQARANVNNVVTIDYGDKFATGDTLSIYVRPIAQMLGNFEAPLVHTDTESGLTADDIYLRNKAVGSSYQVLLVAVFNQLDYTVGTAQTDTYTLQSSFTYASIAYVMQLNMTIVFDGVSKFTITTTAQKVSGTGGALTLETTTNFVDPYWANSTLDLSGRPAYIDCEIGEAYKYEGDSLIGLNSYIDLGSDLPKLASGNNTFTIDNTITSLIIVPRYWQL